MSAASCLLTEDQFLCSICLVVFTDPVSTSCGHNFCKTCITQHWNDNVQTQCPICKEVFNIRPELQVNTFISEMAAQFRQSAQQKASSSSSEQQAAKPGEVPCDVCTGTKLKALKSCLSQPQKVGVFVDYEEGLVSFYDVDAAALIYSFTGCSFTEKLYPFFGPDLDHRGKNSAPLIISPVNHTE
ncbi:hypothetical protein VZT92_024093 [Zoarces viviparus]|uniref:Uncharacterized protein n=1 Tax=Zoarces viviparus TaxID=48416 RepID=A0AAW1E175_ZOAVI